MTVRFLLLPAMLVAGYFSEPPETHVTIVSAAPPVVEKAPPPRAAEDTVCYLDREAKGAIAPNVKLEDLEVLFPTNGVEWRSKAGLGQSKKTNERVIELHWSMRYVGPRPPLIIQKPRLTDVFYADTVVTFYAFPPGEKKGRQFEYRGKQASLEQWREFIYNSVRPPDFFLTVPKGKTATGIVTVPVSAVKETLRSRYPKEFTDDKPPKLYATLAHIPSYRGSAPDEDAWTGGLWMDVAMEVPDLKEW